MKTHSCSVVFAALCLVATSEANATDTARGQALHEKNCIACHHSLTGGRPNSLYTRPDRKVTSVDGLRNQVRRCELSLGLRWFDEDINDVTAFLNQNFYRFGN